MILLIAVNVNFVGVAEISSMFLFVCLELRSLDCDQGTIGPAAATKNFLLPSQESILSEAGGR